MRPRSVDGVALLLATVLVVGGPSAWADTTRPTPLLEVDLKTGKRRAFDQERSRSEADAALDALLSKTTGAVFSSEDLKRVSSALERFLRANRPRALPTLILFLYPGRITRSELKELREVHVDVELVVDPCQRSVCKDAVGLHVELLGRAMRQPILRTASYAVRFGAVAIRARLDLTGAEFSTYRFTAEEVVSAAQRAGEGARLVERIESERAGYDKQMAAAIGQRLRSRRVCSVGPVRLERTARSLSLSLAIRSDRVRVREHVLCAFAAAAEALLRSTLTPTEAQLTVTAATGQRGAEGHRVFGCGLYPLRLHLAGRLSQSELWSTYVVERKREGMHLTFDDDEASSGRAAEKEAPDRTDEILAAHMDLLSPCVHAEARRNRSLSSVTLRFELAPAGRAEKLTVEPRSAGASLRACLSGAMQRIRFPRHGGPSRSVTYPIHIKR